jgi:hypothetical protein
VKNSKNGSKTLDIDDDDDDVYLIIQGILWISG